MNGQPDTVVEELEDDDDLITLEEYAKIVAKSPHSVRNDLSRNPKSVPVPFKLPYSRRYMFRRGAVRKFIRDAEQRAIDERNAIEKKALPKVNRIKRGDDDGY